MDTGKDDRRRIRYDPVTSLIVWLLPSLAVLLLLSSWILRRLIISPMEKLRRLMRQVARQEPTISPCCRGR